jgi:hypothetical protein
MPETSMDWKTLLDGWEREILQYLRENENWRLHDRGSEAIERNSLRYPGADDAQIQALETRLGINLPPSYAAFLRETNGWIQIGMDVQDGRLYPTDEVGWFKDTNPDSLTNWVMGVFLPSGGFPQVPDAVYFIYGSEQDCAALRTEYLATALAISEEAESAIYLLNPQVITPEGEWEAWLFGYHLPGAYRYRSFWDLMQAEYQRTIPR